MSKDLSTEIEVLVPIKLTISGKPKNFATSSFGEKFSIKSEEAKQQNLPECNGHRISDGLVYKAYFNDFDNLSVVMDMDEVFDIALRWAHSECSTNEEAIAISELYKEEDERKAKERIIREIQTKKEERESKERLLNQIKSQ